MGKYDALRDHLTGLVARVEAVTMSFADVEKLVGELPQSARLHRTWWANNSHGQAMAWRAADWHVASVNQDVERVVFVRGAKGGSYAARKAAQAEVAHADSNNGPTGW